MISDTNRRRLANIERLAQDDSVPLKLLRNALTRFIIDSGYFRTPYELYVPLILRARTKHFNSTEEACQYFDNEDKLTCPDPKKVKLGWGRCNGLDEAVFYCADENAIPMFEVRPEAGQHLVLGQYRHLTLDKIKLTMPVIGVVQIVNSLYEREESNSLAQILADDMHYKKEVSPETIAIDQHFASWFTKFVDHSCEYYYRLTTALYQVFTKNASLGDDNERLIGLMYPSVASDITGVNIALDPGFAKVNLRLWGAIMYKVESIDLNARRYCLQPLKVLSGIYQDGSLEWIDSAMSGERLTFDPSTPTFHSDLPDGYLDGMSVYK